MPSQSSLLVNRRAPAAAAAAAPSDVAPSAPEPIENPSTAETVFDFLSSFDAGVKRGRDEAAQTGEFPTSSFTTPTTDGI